jgi:ssDNA-binding Zn-finger/Zn-ribbon topoisomerase 1
MVGLIDKRMFPCPVCTSPREVRITKKGKPYVTCDPCGIQLFVRGTAGIEAFNRLLDRAERDDVFARFADMERRYYVRCPACRRSFWIAPGLAKTSMFDGSLQGFRCPSKDCREIIPWKANQ